MKPVRSSTGSVGSSKIRKRPLSVVDPARQLQFVVGRPVEDEFEQPLPPAPWTAGGGPAGQAGYGADSMGQRAAIPPISVASNSMSVDSFHHGQLPPRPSAMAVPVPSGSKSVDVDEFDADDDDLLLAPESLMMLEQVEQKYSQMFPVAEANNGNSNPMPVRTVDALQQEFDSLPDIPEDGALAGILDGDGLSPDPQARPEKAASEVPVAATPANTNETGFQNQLAQLQAKLNEIVEQKRKLEQDMALKDGEVGMLRRKYGRLEEDLAKVREDLSDKDATIAQVRKEERTKHTKEVEALQTQIRFLEQEQQQAKRSALISSQMPVGFDGHHGLAPSQALRMTPSKAKNVSFARPAAQSPARQRSAPSAEDFGMPGIPQAKPPARDGTSANAKSPVIGNSAQGSQSKQLPGRSLLPPGDKLRLARFSREARAAEDRRNRFISDLFSDPVIAPQNRNNGSSGSASSSSASLFSISVALQPHPSIKVTKDALTGLDLALKGLNAQLMAVVAKKSLPLTSILTPLDSFLDSATELGAIKLVLFSVRLIKMLVKADEGCRKAILESRITTAVGGSDAQSMDLDEEEPRSRTLEHLCILLRHAAFSISPSQHGILTWLTEGPTRELRTDIVSILLSLAWGQSGPSLAKLGLIFDSGWHRHLCMKEQPLGSVKSFVQLCEHLLRGRLRYCRPTVSNRWLTCFYFQLPPSLMPSSRQAMKARKCKQGTTKTPEPRLWRWVSWTNWPTFSSNNFRPIRRQIIVWTRWICDVRLCVSCR